MRGIDLARRHLLRRERPHDPIAHEIGERGFGDMLQLAAAAFAEMAARRRRAIRAGRQPYVGPDPAIGREACRESGGQTVYISVVAGYFTTNNDEITRVR